MTSSPAEGAGGVSADLLAQLARYANLPLAPERAARLAPLLAGSLDALRALRPADYDDLQPAVVYQIPRDAP